MATPDDPSPTAEQAADALWQTLTKTITPFKRAFPAHSTVLKDITTADYEPLLRCPFDARSEHPFGAGAPKRNLCAHGVVARCRFEWFPNSGYTGLFARSEHCVARFSSAIAPPSGPGAFLLGKLRHAKLFPCLAVKALRGGGAPSGNLLFAGAKIGHAETDFFAHGLCTQLTQKLPPGMRPLLRAFEKYSRHPLALGLSEWASTDESGAEAAAPAFPWCLALKPTAKLPPLPPNAPADAFVDSLLSVEAGTAVYDVYAVASPAALADGGQIERVGRLVTTSKMTYSPPDAPLVFKHQAKEEDYALRPEWEAALGTKIVTHDGKTGTADAHVGSKYFDAMIARGRVVDREVPDVGGLSVAG